jgi:hypothetical protein
MFGSALVHIILGLVLFVDCHRRFCQYPAVHHEKYRLDIESCLINKLGSIRVACNNHLDVLFLLVENIMNIAAAKEPDNDANAHSFIVFFPFLCSLACASTLY